MGQQGLLSWNGDNLSLLTNLEMLRSFGSLGEGDITRTFL
jgi:hypothetical protein